MATQEITKDYILDLSNKVVDYAMSKDIHSMEIFAHYYDRFQIMTEGRSIANERDKSEIGFAIRVIKDESEGFSYTNKSELKFLKKSVDDAIGIAKVAPSNPGLRLPSPAKYENIEGIYTTSVRDLTVEELIEITKEVLYPMGEVETDVRTNLSGVTKEEEIFAIVNSLGVEAFQKINSFHGDFFVVPREGERVGSFVFDDFFTHDPLSIDYRNFGKELTERAVRNMDAIMPTSIDSDIVVFKEDAVFIPIGLVISQAVSALSVLHNRSMWKDRLADKVAVDNLNFFDDSQNPNAGSAVKAFDDEGNSTQKTSIIKDGILENFLFDELRASKMNTVSTGNSWRGFGGVRFLAPPSLIMPNGPTIVAGDRESDELIEDIKLGIIFEYFSGSFRTENGMFSGVAKGAQLIKNGELAEPLINVTISGNVFDVLKNIEGVTKTTKLSNALFTTPKIRAKGINISTQN